jgi:hypothetical protein
MTRREKKCYFTKYSCLRNWTQTHSVVQPLFKQSYTVTGPLDLAILYIVRIPEKIVVVREWNGNRIKDFSNRKLYIRKLNFQKL